GLLAAAGRLRLGFGGGLAARVLLIRGARAVEEGDRAEPVKGLPRHPRRIAHPVLVGPGVTARDVLLRHDSGVGSLEARMQLAQLRRIVDLKAEVVDATATPTLRDGEIEARILEHPLRVVGLDDRGLGAEQRRVETDALLKVG